MLRGPFGIPAEDVEKELQNTCALREKEMERLISSVNLSVTPKIHLLKGDAADVIPDLIERGRSLVMGTLSRKGIAGFVVGNTAEKVMTTAQCSLLALKPGSFVSSASLRVNSQPKRSSVVSVEMRICFPQ